MVRRPARRRGHTLEVGALTAFLGYLMQILMAVMMVTFMAIIIPRAAACADRIGEVLDTGLGAPPAVPMQAHAAHGLVEVRDVEYRYPGAELPVLRGISFTARPGG